MIVISVFLVIAFKSHLIIWLNDLPTGFPRGWLIYFMEFVPDLGLGEVYARLREQFLGSLPK
jgi:hypothetical protein